MLACRLELLPSVFTSPPVLVPERELGKNNLMLDS
jgi:hypothetical protein